ncbi:hypothetical protein P9112_004510 [Eukaryota sp. TZLM1-RC]
MVKDTQRSILREVLTFPDEPSPFKLLILDSHGYSLVSTLFKQSCLYEMGFTLFLDLTQKRQPIPSVPAVYLLLPTAENIQRISQDFKNNLYESVYFVFTSPTTSTFLEQLASAIPYPSKVLAVRDCYLHYLAIQPSFFTLLFPNAFQKLNAITDKNSPEINTISSSLLHLCHSLNQTPIIRTISGSVSFDIATQLDSLLREHSSSRTSLSRPLMVLVDRAADPLTPLLHSWVYHALIMELVDNGVVKMHEVNKVEYTSSQNQSKMIVLDDSDPLFNSNSHKELPEVTDAVEHALNDYQLQSKRHEQEEEGKLAELSKVVGKLGELTRVKDSIDAHTTLGHCILKELQDRNLDVFIEVEKELIALKGAHISRGLREKVKNLLMSSHESTEVFGNKSDRIRLFIIYYFVANVSHDEVTEIQNNLDCNPKLVEFIKDLKSFMSSDSPPSTPSSASLLNLAQKGLKMMSSMAVANIPGLDRFRQLPIVQIFNSFLSPVPDHSMVQFDPKLPPNAPPRSRTFDEVILVIVGGCSVLEYHALLEFCKSKRMKGTIGTTDLITPVQLIDSFSK